MDLYVHSVLNFRDEHKNVVLAVPKIPRLYSG